MSKFRTVPDVICGACGRLADASYEWDGYKGQCDQSTEKIRCRGCGLIERNCKCEKVPESLTFDSVVPNKEDYRDVRKRMKDLKKQAGYQEKDGGLFDEVET